jgi:hypothetical protein
MSKRLTEPQIAALAAIAREHPHASLQQIANILHDRTGRKITRACVAWRLYRQLDPDRRVTVPTSDADKLLLRRLIEASGGGETATFAELGRQFKAETGRPIALSTVWKFAIKVMGIKRRGRGSRTHVNDGELSTRIAEARIQKHEGGPPC